MVRWVCKDCAVLVDTTETTIQAQCYQGFACGEKGEADTEIVKLGSLCCNCARKAGIEQVYMIRSWTDRWNNSDYTRYFFLLQGPFLALAIATYHALVL